MNLFRSPTRREAQELEDLVYELYSKEMEADRVYEKIDEILGAIIFGEGQCASKNIYKEEAGNIFEAEKHSSLISGLIMPYPRSLREDIRQSKARFRSLIDVVSKVFASSIKEKFDYYSEDFRVLRHMVFLRDKEVCAKCGAVPRVGFWLEIDHIKPVSKYPELALDIDNLQVLCKDCNRTKSNVDETDYRRNGNALRNY